jgi:hypothetical protein
MKRRLGLGEFKQESGKSDTKKPSTNVRLPLELWKTILDFHKPSKFMLNMKKSWLRKLLSLRLVSREVNQAFLDSQRQQFPLVIVRVSLRDAYYWPKPAKVLALTNASILTCPGFAIGITDEDIAKGGGRIDTQRLSSSISVCDIRTYEDTFDAECLLDTSIKHIRAHRGWIENHAGLGRAVSLSYKCDIPDASVLRAVKHLDLCGCTIGSGIGALGSATSLFLDGANINDCSGLGHVHTLSLFGCSRITDVSMLGNVHDLNLAWCTGITDVSALGNVHHLDLTECGGITNVSALGNVHCLDLSECQGVTDVSALGRVHSLTLRRCGGVTDVSALGNVYELDLTDCSGIRDVSALGGVKKLTLTCCASVTDVSALGRVRDLDLEGCVGVKDVSALGGVHNLSLRDCVGVTDVSALGNVHNLNLSGCIHVTDVSALGNVKSLTLINCPGVRDASALRRVPTLVLSGMESVVFDR